jgi:methyl-accepting chemotaxis protein
MPEAMAFAAAEQLSASIAENVSQVARSSAVAQGAVDQARRTNDTVEGLAAAARTIGEVVTLIYTIAGQTNLLTRKLRKPVIVQRHGFGGCPNYL